MRIKIQNSFLRLMSIAVLTVVASSCQTTKVKFPQEEIPRAALSVFDHCRDSDGGGTISYSDERNSVVGLGYDWVQGEGKFISEISSPVGNTLGRVEVDLLTKVGTVTGNLATSFPKLEVSENGFLVLNGYQVGLKASELSCFLRFKVPYDLVNSYTRHKLYKREGHLSMLMEFKDDERHVWVTVKPSAGKVCAKVKWFYYFGLVEKKLKICLKTSSEPWVGSMEFLNGRKVEWTNE